MGIDTTGYKVVLVLHLVTSIVGFGTIFLDQLRGNEANKRRGPGGLAIGESTFRVSSVAEKFIYAVPILGFGLVGMSDDVWEFSQTWVWSSLVLYLIALAVSHAVTIPSAKRMNVLAGELAVAQPASRAAGGGPPPQVVEMDGLGKKLAVSGAVTNVLMVVVLTLMVFKPGL